MAELITDRRNPQIPRGPQIPRIERTSLLELFHPDGFARSCRVLGENCPPILLPESPGRASPEADLAVLAPSPAECRQAGWLEEAVAGLAGRLAGDSLVYTLAPPAYRIKICRLLRRQGFKLEAAIAHLPNWTASAYLVPLAGSPAGYAFSELAPVPAWKARLARLILRLPGGRQLMAYGLPSAGLITRRPGARPVFEWLFKASQEAGQPGMAVIRPSWRGGDGAAILYCFSSHGTNPSAVAKISLNRETAVLEAERGSLTRLGPSARRSGAQVPRPIGVLHPEGGPVILLQTPVHGRSAAALLPRQPGRLFEVLERLTTWLERWNQATFVRQALDPERLEMELLTPAARLAPLIGDLGYLEWLARRCAAANGVCLPLVAAHNDLTMHNILLDGQPGLGIVDWEKAREQALPLGDFFYAVTDAAAAVQDYASRLKAFQACFTPGGAYAPAVDRLQQRLRRAMEISPELAELCLHACWLQHAANEQSADDSTGSRQFLEILAWLARDSRPKRFPKPIGSTQGDT